MAKQEQATDDLPRHVSVPPRRTQELADAAIGMFLEYRDQHGYDEDDARGMAVDEVMQGEAARAEIHRLEAERDDGWTDEERARLRALTKREATS